MLWGSAIIMVERFCLCAASRSIPVNPDRRTAGGKRTSSPNPADPTSVSDRTSPGHNPAARAAIEPPNEKPTRSNGLSPSNSRMPSTTTWATSPRPAPSGNDPESPIPGRSGTHSCRICANGPMFFAQCRQEPLAPCNRTRGAPLPQLRQTVVPCAELACRTSAHASRCLRHGSVVSDTLGVVSLLLCKPPWPAAAA